jgi:flavin-dependent dehydrogenase
VTRLRDLVIVGGGPAGLAVAIAAARRGLDALVLEREALPADKACGEGILPCGVRALEVLRVRQRLDPSCCAEVRAIRWIDGARVAEARLPAPGGLGVRRTALSAALAATARAAGAEVREGVAVRDHRRLRDEVAVETDAGAERARLLVAADGLSSAIRGREGLDRPTSTRRRFGLRRHFAVPPWSDAVEVHFGEGVEAYVTPAGPGRVGVAFLCEEEARGPYPDLLARFPSLAERLDGAAFDSRPAGAGPLQRAARRRALDRLVLLGDAAGYLDAITGEGVSLALQAALALGTALPEVLGAGAGARSLAGWVRGERLRYSRYAAVARVVLALARRPALRRRTLDLLDARPALFARMVEAAVA